MKIWLIGSGLLFGLISAAFLLVVGVLCGSRRCFLTPWLKLVVMRHGETIAMLLKDRAGGRRVSHIFPNQVVSDVSVRHVVNLVFIFVGLLL